MDANVFAEARKARGLEIARSQKIVKLTDQLWAVPSQQTKGKYAVDAEAGTCLCPDFETHRKPCKHVYAVQYARHQLTDSDGTTVVTEKIKITYRQNWPAYNAAQTSEKDTVQVLLKDLCSGVPQPRYKGNGRPALPWSDVVYGICTKVYSGASARRASSDVRACHEKGLITSDPHFNTVLRYLAKPELTPILRNLIEVSAAPLSAVESNFAVDSTGFTTSTYARYFVAKHVEKLITEEGEAAPQPKQKKRRKWITAHAMVGVKTNIITSVKVTPKLEGDAPQLPGLLNATARRFDVREVSADKAYLSNANLAEIEAVGAIPFIPFKDNSTMHGGHGAGRDAWRRLWHLFNNEYDRFFDRYHQRSNVESTFSAMKRVFGGFVRAKGEVAQVNEVLVKCLVFNTTVLVHEIHALGIEPKFWLPRSA
jgi:transposase